jgi:hypothetical protein
MTKPFVLLAVLFAFLGACSDGSRKADSGSKSVAPVEEAALIDNEDLTPGLKGIDADGNGIRDDIDRLIAKSYSGTSIIKKVAERRARALQQSMEATTPEQAQIAGDAIMHAGDCAYVLLPHATPEQRKFRERMSTEIEALTANTKERLKAYWHSEALSSGMVFRSNNNPVCD